jgi:L-glutamine-phosphate cytidylyltransferase
MRIIIYAAGVSRRLKTVATDGLKGLIKLNGKRIIEYQLDWITRQPISEVIIVLGLEHEAYVKTLGDNYKGVPIIYVYNPDYKDKGNMLSLWHARQYCETDILFTTSDLICDYGDIDKFNKSDSKNKILIDAKNSELFDDPDPVKVYIKEDRIINIRKKVNQLNRVDGTSIGLYKFSTHGIQQILSAINNKITQGNDNMSLYYAIDDVLMKLNVSPIYAERCLWFDVDTPDDLKKAKYKMNI